MPKRITILQTASSIANDDFLPIDGASNGSRKVAASILNDKQDKIIAGSNISIAADGKTISATDTTYTAGNNITISNGEISSTSDVTITPSISTGTKIADYDIDGVTGSLYAPNSGGGGSTVSVTQKVSTGTNIADITVDGVTTGLYAPSGGGGASAINDLSDVNITSPINGQVLKYDSTNQEWINDNESGGGSTVTITPTVQTGTKIADYNINGTSGSLYAPNVDVTTLDFTQLTSQQIYDLKVALGISDVEIYDYAVCNGTGYMTTPFDINSDYTIEVTFDADYVSPSSVYGNMTSPSYSHLTMYGDRWYMSDGSSEVQPISYTSGKHTFVSNSSGSNLMDNVVVSTYTPISVAYPYVIGNRVSSGYYEGKLYEFKLTSITTGNDVYDLVPAKKGNRLGFYDMVSDTFTECSFISSVANDV